jgi:hypothetical protein
MARCFGQECPRSGAFGFAALQQRTGHIDIPAAPCHHPPMLGEPEIQFILCRMALKRGGQKANPIHRLNRN